MLTFHQVRILAEALSVSDSLSSNITDITDVDAAADQLIAFLANVVNAASKYQILFKIFPDFHLNS
jgi:hypothetical protein